MESALLQLPGELRIEILRYLLPVQSVIEYQCSPEYHRSFRPAHRRCGYGPGWRCGSDARGPRGSESRLGILTANQQLSREFIHLLHQRVFKVEIADEIFLANTCDWADIQRFPFDAVKSVAVEVNIPCSAVALARRLELIGALQDLWAPLAQRVAWLRFQRDEADSSQDALILAPLMQAFGVTSVFDEFVAGQDLENVVCASFLAERIEYRG